VAKVDYDSPQIIHNATPWNDCFIWGDKYFSDSRVQPLKAHQRKALTELWKQIAGLPNALGLESLPRRDVFPQQLLPSGVFADFPSKDADGKLGQLLQMIQAKRSWKAYAPHLGEHGVVGDVTEVDGRLLVGSSEGHVECLDIESGRPRWLYTFPVIRQTVSYSIPYGMPPYLAQQAAEYREGLKKTTICGSIPFPSNVDRTSIKWSKLRAETEYPGRIIIDPSPDDPFPNFEGYFTRLAVCAFLPIVGTLVLLTRLARRKAHKKPVSIGFLVAWFLVLSLPPAYGLLEYGRISHSWTIALKAIFAMTIVGAVCGIIRLCFAQRWPAVVVFSVVLIGWLYLMWNPLRFA
jgi:hypothetical protein